jgi:hypothetical protein
MTLVVLQKFFSFQVLFLACSAATARARSTSPLNHGVLLFSSSGVTSYSLSYRGERALRRGFIQPARGTAVPRARSTLVTLAGHITPSC